MKYRSHLPASVSKWARKQHIYKQIWTRLQSDQDRKVWLFSLSCFTFPVLAAQKHPQKMGEELLARRFLPWVVSGFHQTEHLEFSPESSVLVSSDQIIFPSSFLESFKCCLANCCQAVMWLFLRSIFSSDYSTIKSRWCGAAETVVLLAAFFYFFIFLFAENFQSSLSSVI